VNRAWSRTLLIVAAFVLSGRTDNIAVGYQLGGGPGWLHVLLIALGWIAVASIVASAFLKSWWLKALTAGLIVSLCASAAQASLSLAGVIDLNSNQYLAISLVYLIPTLLATGLGYAKGLAEKKTPPLVTATVAPNADFATTGNSAPQAGWYPSQSTPNTDAYWDGSTWTGHTRAAAPISRPSTRSTGRTIGGIVALLVALLAAYLGYGWFQGFNNLQSEGNPFASILGIFGMGAFAVAAAFGIWGLVLLSKK
jgi:hypothetical protein